MEKTTSKIQEFELYSTSKYNTKVMLNLTRTKPLSNSKQSANLNSKQ
jgi:hypothetical protein